MWEHNRSSVHQPPALLRFAGCTDSRRGRAAILSFNLQLLNLFFGMCRGSHGLPRSLHDLGYIPELVESTFANSEDRPVVPDLVIASAQIHHTVVFEFKSGANTEADQLQRYSVLAEYANGNVNLIYQGVA